MRRCGPHDLHCLVITRARYHPNDGCLPAVARAGGVQPPWATAESSLKSSDTLTHRSASHTSQLAHTRSVYRVCVYRESRVGTMVKPRQKAVTYCRTREPLLFYGEPLGIKGQKRVLCRPISCFIPPVDSQPSSVEDPRMQHEHRATRLSPTTNASIVSSGKCTGVKWTKASW